MDENVEDNGVQDDYMDSDEDNEVSASKELPAVAYPFQTRHLPQLYYSAVMVYSSA